ncbi:hypothetical protein E4U34_003364 [Claviceps purpurea]|nr:hypothetical protein E4U34_003364 [Claviceps purpurea]
MASATALRPPTGCLSRIGSQIASSALLRTPPRASFSTTAQLCQRKIKNQRKIKKERNKNRGVSSLYGSGPRTSLSMSDIPLPQPRDLHDFKIPVDETHGLWGFFPEPGKLLWTPDETSQHGRAWTVEELRRKSWEDLHSLWWVCCKQRNLLATAQTELARAQFGFGHSEFEKRDREVQSTMRAIKHALTERYYTWQDAVEVAKSDPEIDLEAKDGQVYKPVVYEE